MHVRKHSYRYQRTIARPAELTGIGFLTGAAVRLRFHPAPPSTGIVFIRTDLHPPAQIPARIDQVTGTHRRTTLGRGTAQVALVEHVLAALAGLRIDNCYVDVNAPEPPGLDGSAQRFVECLRRTGIVLQPARRAIYSVDSPLVVTQNGATLAFYPVATSGLACQPTSEAACGYESGGSDELKISYLLDYGLHSPIDRQLDTQVITPENFANNVACCRTFILESEAAELRRQGLGARITAADLLVFGLRGPIDNTLRYANEPARHKILDLVGDLSLFGADVRGHLVAYRSGHRLNIELVRVLSRQLSKGASPCRVPQLAA